VANSAVFKDSNHEARQLPPDNVGHSPDHAVLPREFRRRTCAQQELARKSVERGEAPIADDVGVEPIVAMAETESPAATAQLMEEVCERENLVRAWQRVRGNKGAPGVDGMTVQDREGAGPDDPRGVSSARRRADRIAWSLLRCGKSACGPSRQFAEALMR
jgi:hypothetical protein